MFKFWFHGIQCRPPNVAASAAALHDRTKRRRLQAVVGPTLPQEFRKLPRAAKDCGDFDRSFTKSINNSVRSDNDFTNLWNVAFRHDAATLRKCVKALDRRHDPAHHELRIGCRILGDECTDRFDVAKGLWRPYD